MKKLILLFVSFAMVMSAQAQASHKFLQKQIRKHQDCKCVTITQHNGDAMLYGNSQWEETGCPVEFSRMLFDLSEKNSEIRDIHLSELGRWVIIYGNNELSYDLMYESLKHKIRECQEDQEIITTVTFNDSGNWIVVTKDDFSASSEELLDWLEDGREKYGQLWTACVTEDAAVAVYELGFKYYGKVPKDLKNALRACKSDVYTVKISGKEWFFKCTDGHSSYHL